jgi:hypothetical protein
MLKDTAYKSSSRTYPTLRLRLFHGAVIVHTEAIKALQMHRQSLLEILE